jgi:hypothetical protein
MRSVSKIRRMQQLNEQLEKRYLNENKTKVDLNEGWFDRLKANVAGAFRRTVTIGQNIGVVFAGGEAQSPALEAAKARIRQRLSKLNGELEGLTEDLGMLYNEKDKTKLAGRAEKLTKRGTEGTLPEQIKGFDEAMTQYMDLIGQLQGANEGLMKAISK